MRWSLVSATVKKKSDKFLLQESCNPGLLKRPVVGPHWPIYIHSPDAKFGANSMSSNIKSIAIDIVTKLQEYQWMTVFVGQKRVIL